MIQWKFEAVTLIFIVICISLTFYLAFLSFQAFDENLKKQLVAFAVSSLITGMVVFTALTVHLAIKRAFQRIGGIAKNENQDSTRKPD